VVYGGFSTAERVLGQNVNHPTWGRIPGGATIERADSYAFSTGRVKDANDASRISQLRSESAALSTTNLRAAKRRLPKPENSALVA